MSEQPSPVQKSVDNVDAGTPDAAARFYERRPDGSMVALEVPREVVERAQAYLWLEARGLSAEAISLIWTGTPWSRVG